jgi:hypothetical protein
MGFSLPRCLTAKIFRLRGFPRLRQARPTLRVSLPKPQHSNTPVLQLAESGSSSYDSCFNNFFVSARRADS